VPNKGDFVVRQWWPELIFNRDVDGQGHAFFNSCRTRSGDMREPRGNRTRFVSPITAGL